MRSRVLSRISIVLHWSKIPNLISCVHVGWVCDIDVWRCLWMLSNEYNFYIFRVESTKVKSRTEAWNLSQGPHKLTCQYGQLLNQMSQWFNFSDPLNDPHAVCCFSRRNIGCSQTCTCEQIAKNARHKLHAGSRMSYASVGMIFFLCP